MDSSQLAGLATKRMAGPWVLCSGAHAVACAGLRFVADAQQFLQQALAADGVEHFEGIEMLPGPVFDARAVRVLGEFGYGAIGSCDQERVVTFCRLAEATSRDDR